MEEAHPYIRQSNGFGGFEEKVDVVRVTKMKTRRFKFGLVEVENLSLLNDFGCKKCSKLGQSDSVPQVVFQLG